MKFTPKPRKGIIECRIIGLLGDARRQGRRKVSNIGEVPILSIPKFAENIGGEELLVARNIGGHVPLCLPLPTALGVMG